MNRPFIVWTHDGKAPEILARAATLPEARALWSNSKHAAISSGGVLADVRNTTGDTQARAMERAAEDAWRTQGATPAPAAAPAAPTRPSRPAATRPPLPRRRTAPVVVAPAPSTAPVEAEPAVDVCPATGCERPGAPWGASLSPALRPLCLSHRAMAHRAVRVEGLDPDAAAAKVLAGAARRRGAPVASEPEAAPVDAAAAEPEAARALDQVRDDANIAGVQALLEAERDAAKIAELRRLLGAVSTDRDALRDRLESAERDADDATRIAREAMEQGLVACDWTRLRAELAEEERDAALEQLASAGETAIAAMSTGLAECERLRERAELLYAEVLTGGDRVVRAEAEVESLRRRSADDVERARAEGRAEANAVARHGGELSRHLAAARDDLEAARIEVTSLRARPEPASALDELALARLVERAAVAGARKAAALTRDAARLLEFADEHGGVDAVIRDARGAARLRKAVGE